MCLHVSLTPDLFPCNNKVEKPQNHLVRKRSMLVPCGGVSAVNGFIIPADSIAWYPWVSVAESDFPCRYHRRALRNGKKGFRNWREQKILTWAAEFSSWIKSSLGLEMFSGGDLIKKWKRSLEMSIMRRNIAERDPWYGKHRKPWYLTTGKQKPGPAGFPPRSCCSWSCCSALNLPLKLFLHLNNHPQFIHLQNTCFKNNHQKKRHSEDFRTLPEAPLDGIYPFIATLSGVPWRETNDLQ